MVKGTFISEKEMYELISLLNEISIETDNTIKLSKDSEIIANMKGINHYIKCIKNKLNGV